MVGAVFPRSVRKCPDIEHSTSVRQRGSHSSTPSFSELSSRGNVPLAMPIERCSRDTKDGLRAFQPPGVREASPTSPEEVGEVVTSRGSGFATREKWLSCARPPRVALTGESQSEQ